MLDRDRYLRQKEGHAEVSILGFFHQGKSEHRQEKNDCIGDGISEAHDLFFRKCAGAAVEQEEKRRLNKEEGGGPIIRGRAENDVGDPDPENDARKYDGQGEGVFPRRSA